MADRVAFEQPDPPASASHGPNEKTSLSRASNRHNPRCGLLRQVTVWFAWTLLYQGLQPRLQPSSSTRKALYLWL